MFIVTAKQILIILYRKSVSNHGRPEAVGGGLMSIRAWPYFARVNYSSALLSVLRTWKHVNLQSSAL